MRLICFAGVQPCITVTDERLRVANIFTTFLYIEQSYCFFFHLEQSINLTPSVITTGLKVCIRIKRREMSCFHR